MITYRTGNLLDDDADALINTVNTVGVMGKGLALAFKQRYPMVFEDYRRDCMTRRVHVGTMHVVVLPETRVSWSIPAGRRLAINFPTKQHWRDSSQYAWIESGILDLVRIIEKHSITSIAVPPLGCGHGGLNWAVVEPMIRTALEPIAGLDVRIYPPVN